MADTMTETQADTQVEKQTKVKAEKQTKNIGSVAVSEVHAVPLWLINATYNYRVVFPRLRDQGYKYIDLLQMGVSDDEAKRAEYCRLVEEFESVPVRDGDMTVISLALNIMKRGQIQTIAVQQLGTTKHKDAEGNVLGNKYGYAIISGSHRAAALAYAYAKWGFVLSNNKGMKSPFVRATLDRVDKQEAAEKSMSENLLRKEPSEYEIGEWVTAIVATGKPLDEVVQEYGRSVSFYRNCMAIYQPAVEGVDGKELMDKLRRREITKAEAVATATGKSISPSRTPKALRTGDGAVNSRSGPVNKVCSYAEVCRKIDETPHDGKPTNVARIRAFAEVLALDYETAMVQSEERLKKQAAKTA